MATSNGADGEHFKSDVASKPYKEMKTLLIQVFDEVGEKSRQARLI
jgi:hypothetical protein